MIGRLWNGIKERSMQDKINIILVSDHGMVWTYVNVDTYDLDCPFVGLGGKCGVRSVENAKCIAANK